MVNEQVRPVQLKVKSAVGGLLVCPPPAMKPMLEMVAWELAVFLRSVPRSPQS